MACLCPVGCWLIGLNIEDEGTLDMCTWCLLELILSFFVAHLHCTDRFIYTTNVDDVNRCAFVQVRLRTEECLSQRIELL